MDEIPAMSTISLPMVISWRTNSPMLTKMRNSRSGAQKTDFLKFDCQPIPDIAVKWGIYCGNDFHWHTVPAQIILTPVKRDCWNTVTNQVLNSGQPQQSRQPGLQHLRSDQIQEPRPAKIPRPDL